MKSQVNQSSPKKTFVCSTKSTGGKQIVTCQPSQEKIQQKPKVQARVPQQTIVQASKIITKQVPQQNQQQKQQQRFKAQLPPSGNNFFFGKPCKSNDLPTLKVVFPGDVSCSTPQFLQIGVGAVGSTLCKRLTDPDQGYSVLVLEAGLDQSSNPLVTNPFEVSQYQGNGNTNFNIINALFDPSISMFQGNPSSNGDGWTLTGLWSAKAVGGSTAHYFCDAVYPTDMVMDGPVQSTVLHTSTNLAASLAEVGGPNWSSTVLRPLIESTEQFELPGYFDGICGVPPAQTTPHCPGFTEAPFPTERGYTGPLVVTQFAFASTIVATNPGEQSTVLNSLDTATSTVDSTFGMTTGWQGVVDDYNIQTNINSVSQLQFFMYNAGDAFDPIRQYGGTVLLSVTTADTAGNLVGNGTRKLLIKTGARVNKIVYKLVAGQYVAKGAEVFIGDRLYFAKAKNVILSAGSASTPCILQRSGVGPAALLNSFNIPVGLDLVLVGQNLHNEYGPKLTASTTDVNYTNTFHAQSFVAYGGIDRRCQTIHLGAGPTSYGRLTAGQTYSNGQAGSQTCTANSPFNGVCDGNTLGLEYFLFEGFMCNPRSRGHVNISGANFGENVDLAWGLYSDGPDPLDPSSGIVGADWDGVPADATPDIQSDIYVACAFMDYAYQTIVAMQALDPSANIEVVSPPLSILTIPDDDFPTNTNHTTRYLAYVPYLTSGFSLAAHEAGVAVMGASSATGVVDSNLKVFGSTNLFVADASILPVQNSGNPGLLLYGIGINAGNLIPTVAVLP